MRKTKKVVIDKTDYVVKEVSAFAIKEVFESETPREQFEVLLQDVFDVDIDTLLKMYPSEVEVLVKTFAEVNSSFLAIARFLKLEKMAGDLITSIAGEIKNPFITLFSASLKEATAELVTTGTASSKQQ